jgi:hypothetical protein
MIATIPILDLLAAKNWLSPNCLAWLSDWLVVDWSDGNKKEPINGCLEWGAKKDLRGFL